MQAHLSRDLAALAASGARGLRQVNMAFDEAASAFERGVSEMVKGIDQTALSRVKVRLIERPDAAPLTSTDAPASILGQVGRWLDRAAVTLERSARDVVGMRTWLRREAAAELRQRWTGLAASDPPSHLDVALQLIDTTALHARERLA